jgi:oxalate decarboxylase/phosphoglucose isomerase-like protein (cupin superfamily)
MSDWFIPLAAARSATLEPGRLSELLLRHGSMSLRYYAPAGTDPQTPHDQDEIYIVTSGKAAILAGSDEGHLTRRECAPGDAIFVPAGHVHRFVDISPGFATWVMFWGPVGGEQV